MSFKKFKVINIIQLLIIIFLYSCHPIFKTDNPIHTDLDSIKKTGKLVAITNNNSVNYFIYNAAPLGYQYDLLKAYAKSIGVSLEIKVTNDIDSGFRELERGKCDILAMDLHKDNNRIEKFSFTLGINKIRQVLVQRKPKNWEKMTSLQIEKFMIRKPKQLSGKSIFIQKNSSIYSKIMSLSHFLRKKINILESDEYQSEDLIKMVADGKLDYVICDEPIALINQNYYPNIDIKTALNEPQDVVWAVRKGEDSLLKSINHWIKKFKKSSQSQDIYTRYFYNPRESHIVQSEFYSRKSGKISPYDIYIKKYSNKIGWDWRLLAALIYQESQFKNDTNHLTGAFGIMQLLPGTAEIYDITSLSSPEQQIYAGVLFLRNLNRQFLDIIDRKERIKFILASYNSGIAHIFDARRLAIKYGKNPYKWDNNAADFLVKKSIPKYYSDPVVYYGYFRGDQTCYFVNRVLELYNHYRNVIKN